MKYWRENTTPTNFGFATKQFWGIFTICLENWNQMRCEGHLGWYKQSLICEWTARACPLHSWMSASCSCAVVSSCVCLGWTRWLSTCQACSIGDISGSKCWPRKRLDMILIQKGLHYSGSVEAGIVLLKQLQGGLLLQEWGKYRLGHLIWVPLSPRFPPRKQMLFTSRAAPTPQTHMPASSLTSANFSQWRQSLDWLQCCA